MGRHRLRRLTVVLCLALAGGSFPLVINAQKWWSPYSANSAKQVTAVRAVVTDALNKTIELSDQGVRPPNFTYSGHYRRPYEGFVEDQLEVILAESPKHSVWVHYSQIDKVVFLHSNDPRSAISRIAVQLENGDLLEGAASDNLIGFRGLVDSLQLGLPLESISTVQFTSFRLDGKVMDHNAAAASWQKQHSVLANKCLALLEDGGRITTAKALSIIDHYLADTAKEMISPRPLWNDYLLNGTIPISKDSGEHREFSFDSIESFVITGKLQGQLPEVMVRLWDGSTVSGGLDMLESVVQKQPGITIGQSRQIKGSLDPEDAIQWWTSYGFETVSLLPLRRISVTFLQRCS
jgi:hypothetical protein